jgi:hypothetical protein
MCYQSNLESLISHLDKKGQHDPHIEFSIHQFLEEDSFFEKSQTTKWVEDMRLLGSYI